MVRIRFAYVLAIKIMFNLDNHGRGVAPGKDLEQDYQRSVYVIDLLYVETDRSYQYEPVIDVNWYMGIQTGEQTKSEGDKG